MRGYDRRVHVQVREKSDKAWVRGYCIEHAHVPVHERLSTRMRGYDRRVQIREKSDEAWDERRD